MPRSSTVGGRRPEAKAARSDWADTCSGAGTYLFRPPSLEDDRLAFLHRFTVLRIGSWMEALGWAANCSGCRDNFSWSGVLVATGFGNTSFRHLASDGLGLGV